MEKQTIYKKDYLRREVVADFNNYQSLNSYHTAKDGGYYKAIYAEKEKQEESKRLFGIELEFNVIERGNVTRENIVPYLNNNLYCYTERDSSLCNGIELISNAQTLKVWKLKKNYIKRVFDNIKDYAEFTRDTGLHIHINKSSLGKTKEQQNKVINNIILIVENFNNELTTLAGRGATSYCNRLSNNFSLNYSTDNIDKVKNNDRYYQVNNLNNNTLEFRLFKSTFDVNKIMAFIEIVNNICEFAKSRELNKLTWIRLTTKHSYKELMQQVINIQSQHEFINNTLKLRIEENERNKENFAKYKIQAKELKKFKAFVLENYKTIKAIKIVLNDNQRVLVGDVLRDLKVIYNEFNTLYNTINEQLSNYNVIDFRYYGKSYKLYNINAEYFDMLYKAFDTLVKTKEFDYMIGGTE